MGLRLRLPSRKNISVGVVSDGDFDFEGVGSKRMGVAGIQGGRHDGTTTKNADS